MLQIDSYTALRRRESASETDRIEMMSDSFHARVEGGYRKLAKLYPQRIVTIDAQGEIEQIAQRIISVVNQKFKLAGMP